jgi:hypothetical protein
MVYFDAGEVVGGAIDDEPMYDWYQVRRDGQPRVVCRQYRDLARWSPKDRRFDKERRQRKEAFKRWSEHNNLPDFTQGEEVPEASEQGDLAGDSPEAVDDDPDQPDAPGDDAEDGDDPED